MTYTLTKDFPFSASHVLGGLPAGHPCGRLHGHNYVIRVQLAGKELDGVGFLYDYGDLAPVKTLVDDFLDHRHLNDYLESNPTAENLARMVGTSLAGLLDLPPGVRVSGVGVSETPKTWAWWTP